MELKTTKKITIYVDAYDLARYLSEKIGVRVEIGDSSNDTDYSVTVQKEEIADYDMDTLNKFFETGWISMEYGYRTILTHCANQDWLEEGNYVIAVSW